jgi:hypothetical protein
MKITGTFSGSVEIEPEEFGRLIASIPPEIRQEFYNRLIASGPDLMMQFMQATLPQKTGIAFPNPLWWLPQPAQQR